MFMSTTSPAKEIGDGDFGLTVGTSLPEFTNIFIATFAALLHLDCFMSRVNYVNIPYE